MFKKTTLFVALFAIIAASLLTLAPQPASALSTYMGGMSGEPVFRVDNNKDIVEIKFEDGRDKSDKTIKARFSFTFTRTKAPTDINLEGKSNGEEWKITNFVIEELGQKFDMNAQYKTKEEKEAFLKTLTAFPEGFAFDQVPYTWSLKKVLDNAYITAAPNASAWYSMDKNLRWEPIPNSSSWKRTDTYTNKYIRGILADKKYETTTKLIDGSSDNTQVTMATQNQFLKLITLDHSEANPKSKEDQTQTHIDPKIFSSNADGTRAAFSCTDTSKVPATVTCATTKLACYPKTGGGILGAADAMEKMKVAECKSNEKCESGKGCVAIPGTGEQGSGSSTTPDPAKVATRTGEVTNPLNTTDARQLIVRIINYLIGLAGTVAVAMIVVGGYQYITSAGNAENSKKAVTTIRNAIIGLIIIVLSYIIVRSVSDVLTGTREKATKVTSTVQTTSPTKVTAPSSTGSGTGLTSAQTKSYDAQCLKDCKAKDSKGTTCTASLCKTVPNCTWKETNTTTKAGTCVTTKTSTTPAVKTPTKVPTKTPVATTDKFKCVMVGMESCTKTKEECTKEGGVRAEECPGSTVCTFVTDSTVECKAK